MIHQLISRYFINNNAFLKNIIVTLNRKPLMTINEVTMSKTEEAHIYISYIILIKLNLY